jgi:hypothetical protein
MSMARFWRDQGKRDDRRRCRSTKLMVHRSSSSEGES